MPCSGLETYRLTSLDRNVLTDTGQDAVSCSTWHGTCAIMVLTELICVKHVGSTTEAYVEPVRFVSITHKSQNLTV